MPGTICLRSKSREKGNKRRTGRIEYGKKKRDEMKKETKLDQSAWRSAG